VEEKVAVGGAGFETMKDETARGQRNKIKLVNLILRGAE